MAHDSGNETQGRNQSYLFINKTSTTLAKNPEESFTISSHVSKTHRRWLKEERLRKLHASSGKAVVQRSILPAKAQSQAFGPARLAPPEGYTSARTVTGSNQPQGSRGGPGAPTSGPVTAGLSAWTSGYPEYSRAVYHFEDGQATDDQEHGIPVKEKGRRVQAGDRPSLTPFRGNSDPFSVAALPLAAQDHEILRQAQRFFVFVACPDNRSAVWRAPIADSSSSHIRLRQTIGDEAEVHAVLAAGYAVTAKSSKHDYTRSLARGLYHKTKAVELLRDRLMKHGFSQSVTTLIRLLISLDFEASDNEAALIHLRGLWAMAATTPGILMDAQELLRVSDAWISISLLKKPEISPARYDPGDRLSQPFGKLLDALQREHGIFAHKPGVVSRHASSAFDGKMWSLLDSAQEIVGTKAIMDKIDDSDLLHEVIMWMNKRSSAVTGYCTTGYVENTEKAASAQAQGHGAESVARTLMAAASLCAMMFMNFQFLDLPTNYNFSKTCQKIEEVLQGVSKRVEHARRPEQYADYLWLLFLTAMGNDVFSARGDIPYSPWPVTEFHRVRDRLRFADQHEVVAALHAYPRHAKTDVFLVELLDHGHDESRTTHIVPWSRWCGILNHA
ncbi:hypothetical protein G647_02440 [Cladophialophora carrionii CBS 160.54]|uniref:Uncharacterized protein n=1 Tax=Cladophialophora carrionii CBS 160.54 TaxID=1279043 RepID=V9DG58_9EURO|nr:uncharacterized protein G647_02440 [Cladophialophora carrionii CBS 160.54]ETI25666.1 hypothetical protein G647_02440 [Cladophialophora carrionii CBS 160.54]